MKTPFVTLAALIAAALVARSVSAQAPVHSLVFTEESSTSLLVTFDGSPVGVTVTQPVGPDNWLVTFPSSTGFLQGDVLVWVEPEDPNFFGNIVSWNSGQQVTVDSDVATVGTNFANGFTFTNSGGNTVTFNDRGDVAAVPDRGSTLALLSLSLVALFATSRLRVRPLRD